MDIDWNSVVAAFEAATGQKAQSGQVFEVTVNGRVATWTKP